MIELESRSGCKGISAEIDSKAFACTTAGLCDPLRGGQHPLLGAGRAHRQRQGAALQRRLQGMAAERVGRRPRHEQALYPRRRRQAHRARVGVVSGVRADPLPGRARRERLPRAGERQAHTAVHGKDKNGTLREVCLCNKKYIIYINSIHLTKCH